MHHITVLPANQNIEAAADSTLLSVLRQAGLIADAPCGGSGRCGKCRVIVNGVDALACQTVVDADLTVVLPYAGCTKLLTQGIPTKSTPYPAREGFLLALDIGTTTVAAYLLDGKNGQELGTECRMNPQVSFGADVISRIHHALDGQMRALSGCIRECIQALIDSLCKRSRITPDRIRVISAVGNPAMQQLFLGILPQNLAQIPFSPVLTQAAAVSAKEYLPICPNAQLLLIPDISGFVGADTVACVLATGLDTQEEISLLVDIGTNGEMVLGNRHRMIACSAAAGPALEGAAVHFGMRGTTGAIDHVWLEQGQLRCSVIGGGEAMGICGSGLIDAVAAGLELGMINERGRIQTDDRCLHLTNAVYLTQEDLRQVQLAKGAIAAGIAQMAAHLGIAVQDIRRVYLAGAFGTFMDPRAACRIGLLPAILESKIVTVGNAAGSGAKILACNQSALERTQQLVSQIEFIELAATLEFPRCFARNMRF